MPMLDVPVLEIDTIGYYSVANEGILAQRYLFTSAESGQWHICNRCAGLHGQMRARVRRGALDGKRQVAR